MPPEPKSADRNASNEGASFVLHARAKNYHWKGVGPLSIKTFSSGRAYYRVTGGHHAVDDSTYLVLNHGQSYEISINSRCPVESFCIFFAPELVNDVQRSLISAPEDLLDEPCAGGLASARFFERTFVHDSILSPEIARLQRNHTKIDQELLTEKLHTVVERLFVVHRIARSETERLNAARPATREELYRRVWRARDYIRALSAERLTLQDIARVASLSQNHLLRTFRTAFGVTPHQFLVETRLQEARRLLATSESTVTDICFQIGFESLGSFSSLFRSRFGVSPSAFRHAKR